MKEKRNIIILIIGVIAILGLLFLFKYINKDSNESTEKLGPIEIGKSYENREYEESESNCCDECECGDTFKILKNQSSSWYLVKIDKGEYYLDNNSFINFNGVDNKFSFFKYDSSGNTVAEIKGNIAFNELNEMILIPKDSNNSITCELGEQKNLIAILECDKNFGTFILQKSGTLNLSNSIKDVISNTKSIVANNVSGDKTKTKNITNEKEVNKFLSIISNSKEWTGATTLPSPMYEIYLYNKENLELAKILYNPGHYFDVEINGRIYVLTNINKKELIPILEN